MKKAWQKTPKGAKEGEFSTSLKSYFESDDIGLVEINKKTGRCHIVQELHSDSENRLAYCAMSALMRDWRNNKFLDVTYWES